MEIQDPEALASAVDLLLCMQGWTSIACLYQTPVQKQAKFFNRGTPFAYYSEKDDEQAVTIYFT